MFPNPSHRAEILPPEDPPEYGIADSNIVQILPKPVAPKQETNYLRQLDRMLELVAAAQRFSECLVTGSDENGLSC